MTGERLLMTGAGSRMVIVADAINGGVCVVSVTVTVTVFGDGATAGGV